MDRIILMTAGRQTVRALMAAKQALLMEEMEPVRILRWSPDEWFFIAGVDHGCKRPLSFRYASLTY